MARSAGRVKRNHLETEFGVGQRRVIAEKGTPGATMIGFIGNPLFPCLFPCLDQFDPSKPFHLLIAPLLRPFLSHRQSIRQRQSFANDFWFQTARLDHPITLLRAVSCLTSDLRLKPCNHVMLSPPPCVITPRALRSTKHTLFHICIMAIDVTVADIVTGAGFCCGHCSNTGLTLAGTG